MICIFDSQQVDPRPRIEVRKDASPLDPSGWGVETWLTALAAFWTSLHWLRKGCQKCREYFRAATTAPVVIMEIREQLKQVIDMQTLSKGRNRALMDTMPYPIWESDANGDCVFANRRMLEVLNVGFEQVRGKAWEARIHHEDREMVYESWYQAVANKTDFELSYRWIDAHGQAVPIAVVCRRIFDEGDKVLGWIANVKLITFGSP